MHIVNQIINTEH